MIKIFSLLIVSVLVVGCAEKPKEFLCSTANQNYSPNFQRSLSLRRLNFISQVKGYFGFEEYELLFGIENYPVMCGKSGNAFTFGQKEDNCKKDARNTRIQFDPINGSLVVFYPKDMIIWSCAMVSDK